MNAPDPIVRPARDTDLPGVGVLLTACGLPSSDLTAASLKHFYIAESMGRPVGVAGFEAAIPYGLLRSVAVDPAFRNKGLAGRLVAATEAAARSASVTALYLLANDGGAARYFARIGYLPSERARVPAVLQALPEFSQLCPQSCPCLCKVLDSGSFKEPEPCDSIPVSALAACPGSTTSTCCKR